MTNDGTNQFGNLLRQFRIDRGMSQTRLARYAETTHAHVSRLESGGRLPSMDMIVRLTRALGFEENDSRRDQLLRAMGLRSSAPGRTFACPEVHLVNDLYMMSDLKTQVDVRLALRLLAEGMDNRLKRKTEPREQSKAESQ